MDIEMAQYLRKGCYMDKVLNHMKRKEKKW